MLLYDNKDVIIYIPKGKNKLYIWKEKSRQRKGDTVKSDKIVFCIKGSDVEARIKLEIEDVFYITEVLRHEALRSYDEMRELSLMLKQKFLEKEKANDDDRSYL